MTRPADYRNDLARRRWRVSGGKLPWRLSSVERLRLIVKQRQLKARALRRTTR